MISFQWRRITAIGFLILAFLEVFPGSSIRKDIKKLKLLNKKEGSWSPWSPWTPCSRPCGGGIRSQTRQCQIRRSRLKSKEAIDEVKLWKNVTANHCDGHQTRHHLCNPQECSSGSIGIRESQCKAYSNRPFMGKNYQWEAFVDEKHPCSLTCRAKGFRFFTTLNKSVIDGTPCHGRINNGRGIVPTDLYRCVMGQCLSIGCDGIPGSQRRFDRCGVCGGDNSTCRVISGIFTRPQLPVGYNMVAHIPRGACNLNITQIRKSPNYLALRRNDGSYILNGNWAISWAGEYEGAGSKFHYIRQDTKSLESIDAPGPLTEPIDLLVLSQHPNPGIKYEYMLPMNDAAVPAPPDTNTKANPRPAALTYQHQRPQPPAPIRPSAFVPLNNQNRNNMEEPRTSHLLATNNPSNLIPSIPKQGGQLNYPSESAYSIKPQVQIQSPEHPHLHGHHGRRSGHGQHHSKLNQPHAPSDKRFFWKVMGHTNCSEPCGGGTQKTIIRCVKEATGAPAPDRRCIASEKPPPQSAIRCNLRPCPAEWIVAPWSTCSEVCGEGSQTRTVNCQQKISPTLTMRVADGACLSQQPDSIRSCFVKACHRWESTPWTPCSTTCGNGIRSRTVKCISADGNPVTQCSPDEKPFEISPCNMGPCEGRDWFTSDWTNDCSETCGKGIQTRHVLCTDLNGDARRRRFSSRETETNVIGQEDLEDLNGNGRKSTGEVNNCDEAQRPSDERECFAERECRRADWFAGPWTECSSSCGNGIKTRQTLCVVFSREKFRIVEDSQCAERSKPNSKESCVNDAPCPARWFMTEWNECSVSCGGGTQRRSVSCRGSNWTLAGFTCLDSRRPLDRRSCSEQACGPGFTNAEPEDNKLPVASAWSREQDSRESTSYVPVVVQTTRKPQPVTVGNVVTTSHTLMEPNEEPDSSECTDQYKNCALVVQARLCHYKYYRSVCCTSCADN